MGSWYRSFSFRGDVREPLTEALDRWLRAKGFERLEAAGPSLLAPDARDERGAFLLTSPDWTTLVYSEMEEEDRLALELERLDRALLRFFVVDSDVWAYELRADGEAVSAFQSRSGLYDDLPDGPNDLDAFVRVLGLPNRPADLARLQRQRAVLAERPAEDFLAAIGLRAAATQYDYVWAGEYDAPGFTKTELLYRRPGFDPMHGFDLHLIEPRPEASERQPPEAPSPELAEILDSPRVKAQLAFAKILGMLFRALFWLAKPWLRWRMEAQIRSGPPAPGAAGRVDLGDPVLREGVLKVPHLGFRLTLPEDVEGPQGHRLFRWRGLDVSVRVSPPDQVRAILSTTGGAARLLSRNLFFGPLQAKAIVYESKGPGEAVFRTLAVYVATERGIYRFHGGAPYGQAQPTADELEVLVEPLSTFERIEVTASGPDGA